MLDGHVLVLNRDYRAISVCSVRRALVLVLLHKAELIAPLDGQVVRSPSLEAPWPSVIRLKVYVHFPYRKVMLTRKNVLKRDGNQCQYCGSRNGLTVDHVLPRSRGGEDRWENLVAACVPCNNRKGDRTPEEARMTLRRAPFHPSHVMFLRDFMGTLEDSWKPFLFLS